MSGTIQVTTTGTLSGYDLVTAVNTALASMVVNFTGTTAPTAAGLGLSSLADVVWHDISGVTGGGTGGTSLIKQRDHADTAWVTLGTINHATKTYAPANAALAANNLSDLANAATARTNLGVYSTSQVDALVAAGTGTVTATAGEAIDTSTAPKLVYKDVFNQRGGGAAKWYLVDTDATSPVRISPVVGIATTSAAGSGNTFTCHVLQGQVSGFSGLTADTPVWASSTAGGLTQTEPAVPSSGTQNAVRIVGYAVSTSAIMFEPWHDTVFQARNSTLASASTVTVEHFTDSGARERTAQAYIAAPPATSYANAGGSGNRTSSITFSYTGGGWASGAPTNALIDGNTSNNSALPHGCSAGASLVFDFGAGATEYFSEFKEYYQGTGGDSSSWKWQGSNDGSSWSDMTAAANWGTSSTLTHTVTGNSGPWRYVRKYLASGSGTNQTWMYEVEFKIGSTGVSRDEPLTIGSETVNSSASDRVTVKFSDSSDANQDTKTTFTNRTGATRDLVAEIIL